MTNCLLFLSSWSFKDESLIIFSIYFLFVLCVKVDFFCIVYVVYVCEDPIDNLLRQREFARLLLLLLLMALVLAPTVAFFFTLFLSSRCGVYLIFSRSYLLDLTS